MIMSPIGISRWAQPCRTLSIKSVQISKAIHANAVISIPLVQKIHQVMTMTSISNTGYRRS